MEKNSAQAHGMKLDEMLFFCQIYANFSWGGMAHVIIGIFFISEGF